MSRAIDFLRATQNADGGWGYKPGGMSFVEPTAAVILALSQDAQFVGEVQRARTFLKGLQRADGGWGIAALDDESGWMTAWAVWCLAKSEVESARRGVRWLLEASGIRVSDGEQIAGVSRVLKIDATITGWAWQQGDAAWVFPTSIALLALYAMDASETSRAREGIAYLLDRAIVTGGWNIGNPFMVTGTLTPTVENTAIALMALSALGVESDVTRRAEQWLGGNDFTNTAFEWAWRGWYWKQVSAPSDEVWRALEKLQLKDGSFDHNPFTTAIAVMGGVSRE